VDKKNQIAVKISRVLKSEIDEKRGNLSVARYLDAHFDDTPLTPVDDKIQKLSDEIRVLLTQRNVPFYADLKDYKGDAHVEGLAALWEIYLKQYLEVYDVPFATDEERVHLRESVEGYVGAKIHLERMVKTVKSRVERSASEQVDNVPSEESVGVQ